MKLKLCFDVLKVQIHPLTLFYMQIWNNKLGNSIQTSVKRFSSGNLFFLEG